MKEWRGYFLIGNLNKKKLQQNATNLFTKDILQFSI